MNTRLLLAAALFSMQLGLFGCTPRLLGDGAYRCSAASGGACPTGMYCHADELCRSQPEVDSGPRPDTGPRPDAGVALIGRYGSCEGGSACEAGLTCVRGMRGVCMELCPSGGGCTVGGCRVRGGPGGVNVCLQACSMAMCPLDSMCEGGPVVRDCRPIGW